MAGANYEVNIQLKADPALKSLERIEQKINALTKTSVDLQDAKAAAMVKNRNLGAQINKLEERGVQVAQLRERLEKSVAATDKLKLLTAKAHIDILDDEIKAELQILNIKKQQQAVDSFGGAKKGLKGTAGSALIGGAFPLLFGQGGAAAAGGAIGGAVGGLLGGELGFGLSLLGTFIGQQIQEAKDLERNLASLNSTISDSGDVSMTTAQDVRGLSSALNMQNDEVLELLKSFQQIQDGGAREALASIFAGVGGASTFETIAAAGRDEERALESIFALRKIIGNEQARSLALSLTQNGAIQTQQLLMQAVVENSIKAKVAAESQVNEMDHLRAALAQSVVFAAELVKFTQDFKLPGLDFGPKIPVEKLDEVINKYKEFTAESFATQRGKELEGQLRKNIELAFEQLDIETEFIKLQDVLGGKVDNTIANLLIDLDLRRKRKALSIDQAAAEIEGNTAKMDELAIDAVLLDREAAIAKAKLDGKSAAETELRIKLATIDADQKITDILNNRQKAEAAVDKQFEKTLSGLDLQLEQVQAISGEQKDALAVKRIELSYLEKGKKLTVEERAELLKKVQDIRRANEALKEQQFIQNTLNNLVNTAGLQFSGLLDDLITGTNNWNDALQNILKTLSSVLMQTALKLLAGDDGRGFFSILTGSFTGKALGGQVSSGTPYMVGERGPEMFVPGAKGNIVPNNAMGGVQVGSINISVENTGDQLSPAAQKKIANEVQGIVMSTLVNERRSGGLLR